MIGTPIQIQKVIELEGAYREGSDPSPVFAHISKPVKESGQDVQYAILARFPQHGIMYLGSINPETMMFEYYDPAMNNPASYTRAGNQVVNQVSVPSKQLKNLETLEEVLGIEGISVKRELIPE